MNVQAPPGGGGGGGGGGDGGDDGRHGRREWKEKCCKWFTSSPGPLSLLSVLHRYHDIMRLSKCLGGYIK